MSTRGGKREGAGRPSTNKPTTKATIYIEDRELLNAYAKELNMPVNELIHKIINNDDFSKLIEKIKADPNKDSWKKEV